jgi:hypothetical protein
MFLFHNRVCTMSGLLLGMVLSVCICWFHSMVTLSPRLVSTDFGTCSYQCFASNCTPVYLHKCSCAHTLSCLFILLLLSIFNFKPSTIVSYYLAYKLQGCETKTLVLMEGYKLQKKKLTKGRSQELI